MRSEVPVRPPKTANAGRGKTPSGTHCPLKPSSRSSRILRITEVSRRPSSLTTTRGPRSSGNWCSASHRCYGDYAAPPSLRPNCSGSRQRSWEIVDQAIWRSGREIRHRCFLATRFLPFEMSRKDHTDSDAWPASHSTSGLAPQPGNSARDLAHCFLRLANLDNGVFERLGRYESALSRQVVRILFLPRSTRVS
jgi:hypothetical protein